MRQDRDVYLTPPEVVATVLPLLPESLGTVLDPSAGKGVFERVLGDRASAWHNIDILPEMVGLTADFLNPATRSVFTLPIDSVITNPPFSLAQSFIEEAFRYRPKRVVMLCRLGLLASQRRYPFWQAHPPDVVAPIVPRPSFTGGGADLYDYAWFGWGDVPVKGIRWVRWTASRG